MKTQFNIDAAIELYYSQNELSNRDIKKIFGCGDTYAVNLKKAVLEKAPKEDVPPVVFDAKNVNCEYAFAVWGLDIDELVKKYKKLQSFRKLRGDAV